jgi:hypothetical protein
MMTTSRTRSIQEAIDKAANELNNWTTALPFTIHVFDINSHLVEMQCENILKYLDPMYKGTTKIYFANKYNKAHASGRPLVSGFGEDSGWNQLLKDLELASLKEGGFYAVSNGSDGNRCVIVC